MINRNERDDLKKELIKALERLCKEPVYRDQIIPIVKDLKEKDVVISKDAYGEIIDFVHHLAYIIKNPLKNHQSALILRNLYVYCHNQLMKAQAKATNNNKPNRQFK